MTAQERLLARAADYIAANGVVDLSLRALATGIGTSHRMLLYHFGSKEGLLVAVVRLVEERQRAALADVEIREEMSAAEITRAFWKRFSHPRLAANERLFFEIYGQALQNRPGATAVLEGVVDSWVAPLVEMLKRLGFPSRTAAAQARLSIAVTRGLLLDLLATGDRRACNAAMEQYIRLGESYLAAQSAG